jgi:exodeoxyribonuclease V alpha subunit
MNMGVERHQLDISFGRFLAGCSPESADLLFKAGWAVSQARREGHVCVDIRQVDPAMDPSALREALLATKPVGVAGDYCPLIIHGEYLYLHRYFKFETIVVDFIENRSAVIEQPVGAADLVGRLFPHSEDEPDQQRQAALSSLVHSFLVISGGPGTGKTTTVAKILALHFGLNADLRVMLAAPTGKASARLEESLADAIVHLDVPQDIKDKMGLPVQTVHRLLGFSRSGFSYNADNPLAVDLLLVDEASMVDLPLMADLMLALPETCQLILLGDQYQLASVQPGAVLGEICSGQQDTIDELPSIVTLEKSFRFRQDSGIRLLADFVKEGDAESALQVLQDEKYSDVALLDYNIDELLFVIQAGYKGGNPEEILAGFSKLGVLCCHRSGLFGVEDINARVIKSLNQTDKHYFHGLPLMILANDHEQKLYNGDTCVVVEEDSRFYACFKTSEGLRKILVRKLPAHVPAYGITVHKSQGSEYTDVAFLLPEGASKVLGRELVYTAITRARKKVVIYGTPEQFSDAVVRKVVRISGLGQRCLSR